MGKMSGLEEVLELFCLGSTLLSLCGETEVQRGQCLVPSHPLEGAVSGTRASGFCLFPNCERTLILDRGLGAMAPNLVPVPSPNQL